MLLVSIGQAFGYDSLQTALKLHQASQYQKALPVFIRLSEKFKKEQDISNYALCQLKIADIIRNYGGNNVAIELLTINERFLALRLEKETILTAQNYIAKAEAYYSTSRLTDFKASIEKSITIKKQLQLPEKYLTEDYLHLARYYKEFRNQGDSCLYWIKKSLVLAKSDRSLSLYTLPRIYNLFGYYYHPASIGNYLGRIPLFYTHLNVSRKYYDSALWSIGNQKIKDDIMLGKVYHNLGNSFNNEFSENVKTETMNIALGFYRKSITHYETTGSPTDLVIKDWVIGRAYERLRKTDSAIVQFQTGMKRLVPDFKSNTLQDLPELQPTLNDSWFLSLLSNKANNFYTKYKVLQNDQDLLTAYQHYMYLLKFHRYLLSQSLNENESISWSFSFTPISYQLLIKTTFELVTTTGDMDYLRNVYPLISSAKYAWLNKQDIEPSLSEVIKKSVLKEEVKLVKRQILKTIPTLSEANVVSILPVIPAQTVSSLSQIKLAHQVLDTTSVSMIQQELEQENSTLLDFYVWDKELYTVIISKDTFRVVKQIVNAEFRSDVYKLKKSSPAFSAQEYARVSNKVYRETLDSLLENVPKAGDRLIICPDDNLVNIPWEALVSDTSNIHSFKELNYLLNQYSTRTVLFPKHLLAPTKKADGFYGVASDFTASKRFSSIPFSSSLVTLKADEFNGSISTSLLKDSLSINIFHVASHVVTDSLKPYRSMMYFNDFDSISLSDFSKSAIRPKLAILNGCQTGSGTYYQSEGTISFARAFYRMGAESVLMTLWSVDDKSTADILGDFYEEMENGTALDVSLRNAKIHFIKNATTDEQANPYYWAGLQLSGNAKPLFTGGYYRKLFFGIFSILLIAGAVYFSRSRKTNH